MAKPGLTSRQVLLSICWDWKEIVYYELLSYGQTLNSNLYCQKLDRLKLVIDRKRPELAKKRCVALHQNNTETLVCNYLLEILGACLRSFNVSTI